MKVFDDKNIIRKSFTAGQKVLLFNHYLHLLLSKLCSRWYSPFIVYIIFPYRAIKNKDLKNNVTFKVNDQRLKLYLEY